MSGTDIRLRATRPAGKFLTSCPETPTLSAAGELPEQRGQIGYVDRLAHIGLSPGLHPLLSVLTLDQIADEDDGDILRLRRRLELLARLQPVHDRHVDVQ